MSGVTTDGTAVSRASNADNQITDLSGTTNDPVYDAAGNMIADQTHTYAYDAWNRMTAAYERTSGGARGALIAEYQYDGRGYRTAVLTARYDDAQNPATVTGYDRTDYLYDANWQVVEERFAANLSPSTATSTPATTTKYQYVWSAAYIDASCAATRSTPAAR